MAGGEHVRTVGVVAHPRNPVAGSLDVITRFAREHGVRVVAPAADAERLGHGLVPVPPDGFADEVDVVISLGGDGTMLGAMRLVVGRPTPVLGVNHGNLGFLVELAPTDLPAALDRLTEGDFSLEPHSCIRVEHTGGGPAVAFNDAVLTSARPWTAVNVDLSANGVRHGYYRCDAVVACTPTGSTAYNHAAGGPVISPSVRAIGLTPVAPMTGIDRTVLFGADDVLTLANPSDAHAIRLTLDGADVREVGPGGELTLALHPSPVNLVRFDAAAHARRSRVKLSLLDLPLRPDQLLELVPEDVRERARRLPG